mgnify:CR=1 FL=1
MADLTQRAKQAAAAASPGTRVFAASTTTRLAKPMAKFFGPYAKALSDRGMPIDGWTLHSYPAANAGPAARYDGIVAWQKVVKAVLPEGSTALDLPVWDTEVNYGLAGPGAIPHTDFDASTSGQFVARTILDSVRAGLDGTFWYLWTAGPYSLLGVQMYSGTTATIGAYNTMRNWIGGATFRSCEETSDGFVKCYFTKGGAPFVVARRRSALSVRVRTKVSNFSPRTAFAAVNSRRTSSTACPAARSRHTAPLRPRMLK